MARSAVTILLYKAIAADLQKGVAWADIRAKHSVGSATVSRARAWAFENVKGFSQPAKSAEADKAILAEVSAHKTLKSAAKALDMSPRRVGKAVRRAAATSAAGCL